MKKAKQKLMKHYICSVARVVACVSFLVLAIIGVSSLVRAMSLESIANENGIPTSWEIASLGNPESITVPITYWDQRQDDCDDENRQFEWVICHLYTAGALQGVVKDHLGTDGLPIPSYTNANDAWAANQDVYTMNVTGHEPVVSTDNFYRWFHETEVSKKYDREITFYRTGKNTYTYGSRGVFPLDDVNFSDNDTASEEGHNFHFTSHLRIPIKITADGTEKFEFLGDDDVWVFLNGHLVLDIGGLHEAVAGSFTINQNGTLTTHVDSIANVADRSFSTDAAPSTTDLTNRQWVDNYRDTTNALGTTAGFGTKGQTDPLDIGLKAGDVVNLDFFYAERSTTESNTQITISNMHWPISADSNLDAEIVGKIGSTNSNLVEYNTSITNRDPDHPLDLERIAVYVNDTYAGENSPNTGFLPLDVTTLYYTTTPEDEDSWQPVKISAPANSLSGFKLETPIRMDPNGVAAHPSEDSEENVTGDTLYFRYFAETSDSVGKITAKTSYYTMLNGVSGVTYDYATVSYDNTRPAKTSTVTVHYVYEDGTPAAESVSETHNSGDSFSIDSPEIDGHDTDQPVVSGKIFDDDLTYTVIYTRTPEPEQPDQPDQPEPKIHRVTIHYVDEDGDPVADSYTGTFPEGDSYLVKSPEVEGYTTNDPTVSGIVPDEDITITVVYIKSPVETPVTPTTPVEPSTPTDPEPSQPTPPSSDIIDNGLSFFAPLGEVAYVPNTGIISDFVAPVFEQYFASAILSQSFILVVLLIFAGSFATYFSLRKYLDFTAAKATATAGNKPRPMPKHLTKTSKAAKSTTKKTMAAKPVKLEKTTKKTAAKTTKAAKAKK